MLSGWLTALEETALGAGLRTSLWAYPWVNAGHILGVALLVGTALPLGFRLLGFWSQVPLDLLKRVLNRTFDMGLGLTVVCGLLLFAARASSYGRSAIFLWKMGLLGAGIASTVLLRQLSARQPSGAVTKPAVRLAAVASLVIWPGVLVLGRMIAYF